MAPSEVPDHANGESPAEDSWYIRIVMCHRRNSGEQVFESSPQQSERFGKRELFLYGRTFRMIDGASPFHRIAVRARTQTWKQVEFEMIVSVDEPGQYQTIRQ